MAARASVCIEEGRENWTVDKKSLFLEIWSHAAGASFRSTQKFVWG